eukprot:scaffold16814_cov69-Phaeocystis_antarctica.AAC.4
MRADVLSARGGGAWGAPGQGLTRQPSSTRRPHTNVYERAAALCDAPAVKAKLARFVDVLFRS